MANSNVRNLLLNLAVWLVATVTAPEVFRASAQMSGMNMGKAPDSGAHQDHNPKHGGTFFMAMDNRHHVEGLLVPPGVFRLYLYDSHTHPVGLAELKKANGTVQWGAADNAPQIPLVVASSGEYLEAVPGKEAKLPVELTLRLRLPGESVKAKPELFTFPFSHYTEQDNHGGAQEHEHSGHEDH